MVTPFVHGFGSLNPQYALKKKKCSTVHLIKNLIKIRATMASASMSMKLPECGRLGNFDCPKKLNSHCTVNTRINTANREITINVQEQYNGHSLRQGNRAP
jgi:hypothetical protein